VVARLRCRPRPARLAEQLMAAAGAQEKRNDKKRNDAKLSTQTCLLGGDLQNNMISSAGGGRLSAKKPHLHL